jgi:vacuolar-type H+-ATPase subunit I/STV1
MNRRTLYQVLFYADIVAFILTRIVSAWFSHPDERDTNGLSLVRGY